MIHSQKVIEPEAVNLYILNPPDVVIVGEPVVLVAAMNVSG
jgi:hypothetical protein